MPTSEESDAVSLFSTHPPASEDETRGHRTAARRRRPVGRTLIGVAAFLGVVLVAVAPSAYAIERPGPAFDTLGVDRAVGQSSSGRADELISIPDRRTYPTAGSLDLLTVNVVGTPSQPVTYAEVMRAWADPSEAVVPLSELYPDGQSASQQQAQNEQLMTDSQRDAIAAALDHLGYDFPQHVTVGSVIPDSPASGELEKGDDLVSVNGMDVDSVSGLRTAIAANGTQRAARLTVIRDGEQRTVSLTPELLQGSAVIGIGAGMDYRFPFTVDIRLDDVGGPSAGMMFALGIIDELTPGHLNGGAHVAGTGTIDNTGAVGPIGGIRQKMYGAKAAGATYFLAPRANCDEVTGHVPAGLEVFSVRSLRDSLAVLTALREKEDLGSLPTCGG